MIQFIGLFISGWMLVSTGFAQTNHVLLTTLNCYFFFGGAETGRDFDQPQFAQDYWRKATNLVNLLPTNPPLFVALQEIGRAREVVHLAQVAATRYRCSFIPIFVQGKDTFTAEDVGAFVRLGGGWGIASKPARDHDLDKMLSKHLVVTLTNRARSLEVCIVHLRRAIGRGGADKQKEQNRALGLWAQKHFQKNRNANVVILGDFNETKAIGDPAQSLAVLLHTDPPFADAFVLADKQLRTHANGKSYDRILVSQAIANGVSGLRFEDVFVTRHSHGKSKDRRFYSDHYPVTVDLITGYRQIGIKR